MEITIIKNLSVAYINTFALKCAVDLDISGCIQAYGQAMPLNELARSIPIPPEKDSMLARLMALLVHQGIFAQSEAGYLLTPVSELLLIDGSNMGAFVQNSTNENFIRSWGRLSEVFTDTGASTLFQKANNGKEVWEVLKETSNRGNLFNEAMASHSKPLMRGLVGTYPHIFDGLHSLVDVGGGTGTAVKIIAEAFPGLRCTVFDLPQLVAEASRNDNFHVIGGDMFEKIPPADAIFLKVSPVELTIIINIYFL